MNAATRSNALLIGIAIVAVAFIVSVAFIVHAQEDTISYPVAELGNCGNKSECHAYCDDLAHVTECVNFAETHGLMKKEDVKAAREFARLGGKGPGGCTSKESCESYCEDSAHMRQCIAFAKQAGIMEERELAEAEKVVTYIESGGTMPGGCKGEKECRTYCEAEEHMEECVNFASKAGFMSEKEVELFRKTGGKGPGGCKGRACEKFCQDETNREACISFALEHDLMSEEDKARMKEGLEKMKEAMEKAPPEVRACIEAAIGSEKVRELQEGRGVVSPRYGEILPECFRTVMGGGSERGPFGPGSDARECMRKIFGDDFEEKMRSGELDPGARDNEIRACMEEQLGGGFLNDAGRWERPEQDGQEGAGNQNMPREGFDRARLEGEMRGQYRDGFDMQGREHGERDAIRKEMEMRMRQEIESQMRSGTFDRSKLPADFRPEGVFLPPEAQLRPPEGRVQPGMMDRPEGVMPPDGGLQPMPKEFMTPGSMPEGGRMPPPSGEPVSLRYQLTANVLTIVQMLLGVR